MRDLRAPGRYALIACLWTVLLFASQVASPDAAAAPTAIGGAVRVPILMYHYIRVNPVARDRAGADLSVAPRDFVQEMQLLASTGFHTVSLDDLTAALVSGRALPPKPVVLTFDDGYEDFYTAAYSVLRADGFRATSFVITGLVGAPGYLTWSQMREMEASGLVQFESHTVHHMEMTRLSIPQAQRELLESKWTLEMQLGVPVRYFCYPSGRYNARIELLVLHDGYTAAVSTRYGEVHTSRDLGALTRIRIHGGESIASFAAAVGISSGW
jgi:peptidoglycan/xylan/chitin deacetylase (PgdA/CDA1 family)